MTGGPGPERLLTVNGASPALKAKKDDEAALVPAATAIDMAGASVAAGGKG